MRELNVEEKVATVMMYTPSMLFRGDLIVRENVRVSIWPRTQGVPNYIHLYNAHIMQLAGSPPKPYTKSEIYVSTSEVIAFHLAPPAVEPLDFDESELNRKMEPVNILAGSFEIKTHLRVSSAADFESSLEVMTAGWVSLYDSEVSNPYLPQFHISVPMMLIRPSRILIGMM